MWNGAKRVLASSGKQAPIHASGEKAQSSLSVCTAAKGEAEQRLRWGVAAVA